MKVTDTELLRVIADLAEKKSEIDNELTEAIRSKQAAQRKYATKAS